MKIIYNPTNMDDLQRENALNECRECFHCGEERSIFHENGSLIPKGIGVLKKRIIHKGFLFSKRYEVTRFKCFTCGAEFESDPYPAPKRSGTKI